MLLGFFFGGRSVDFRHDQVKITGRYFLTFVSGEDLSVDLLAFLGGSLLGSSGVFV